jgi:hypothetical protein
MEPVFVFDLFGCSPCPPTSRDVSAWTLALALVLIASWSVAVPMVEMLMFM